MYVNVKLQQAAMRPAALSCLVSIFPSRSLSPGPVSQSALGRVQPWLVLPAVSVKTECLSYVFSRDEKEGRQ